MTRYPNDWKRVKLDSMGDFFKGSGITKNQVRNSGVPVIRYGEIYTIYNYSFSECVSYVDDFAAKDLFSLKHGDILFAGSGETKEEIGKSVAYLGQQECYAGGDIVILRPKGVDSAYLGYALNSTQINSQKAKAGKGDAVVHISSSDLKQITLWCPLLHEQKAIAKALSDMDELIDNLEILIEKKSRLFSGFIEHTIKNQMQSKKNIREYKLGDLGKTYGGLSGKVGSDFGQGNGEYITFLNVLQNFTCSVVGIETVRIKNGESQNVVMQGDILFNGSSETPAEVGLSARVPKELSGKYLNSFCFGYRLFSKEFIDPLYFAYLSRSLYGRNMLSPLAQGSTRYNLSKYNLMSTCWEFPSLPDQQKSASAFDLMKSEIDLLRLSLDKYKAIEEGMMHDLLTGKVRLV
jgi:type I restriction enzyme S subunit